MIMQEVPIPQERSQEIIQAEQELRRIVKEAKLLFEIIDEKEKLISSKRVLIDQCGKETSETEQDVFLTFIDGQELDKDKYRVLRERWEHNYSRLQSLKPSSPIFQELNFREIDRLFGDKELMLDEEAVG